ncbi:MAG: rod shape-determining protein RodA [Bacteroidetes bacterium]|nr:rod shape-determining protein RodA [Bacteroidota bacterium]
MRPNRGIFGNADWIMIWLYLVLVFFGWMNIYAAVYNEDHGSIFDISQNYGKQALWIVTGFILALTVMLIDFRFYLTFPYLVYGIVCLLLIAVVIFGKEIAGSKSWFEIGPFRLQPSEFAKFATCLALAKYLSGLRVKIEENRTKITSSAIIAIPPLLILLQPDAGSALIYSSLLLVLYREGLSSRYLWTGVFIIMLFLLALLFNKFILIGVLGFFALSGIFFFRRSRQSVVVILLALAISSGLIYSVDYAFNNILEPHQRSRINVLLGTERDIKGVGYNVNQSLIAIGSGGFTGKGFLQGTQTKYDFVPEQSTDFIFCTIGEEWGFLGSLLTIGLFVALLARIIFIAERQRSKFSRIYGYCVASVLFFHFAVNMGMTMGLAPVIGIPLPFISYGGSSLWGFTILLFLFIKFDSVRLEILR